jgi:hypothetical protein
MLHDHPTMPKYITSSNSKPHSIYNISLYALTNLLKGPVKEYKLIN